MKMREVLFELPVPMAREVPLAEIYQRPKGKSSGNALKQQGLILRHRNRCLG